MIETDALIIGAGPVGLFQVFELGLLGIRAHVVEALEKPGGQCIELYPDKPIYDIPAIPICTGRELTEQLMAQIAPFEPVFHLDQQVTSVSVPAGDDPAAPAHWLVETSKGTRFLTRSIIIAGGVGSFMPVKLRVDGAERFLDSQLFYRVRDPGRFTDRDVVVLGGGDSALDWALSLVETARSLTLIHRTTKFRAQPASVEKMRALEATGQLRFLQGVVDGFAADGDVLKSIQVRANDDSHTTVELEDLLVFFGLSPKLGPIEEWGLTLDRNQIEVDTEKFETNRPGIYAIGDICTYPGKKKLILSGFHEGALAAFGIKARLNPDEKVFVQYTTTSPIMHKRLGVERV